MLEKTEGAIKNGQSKETGNIENARHRTKKNKTQHNMCWTPLYTHAYIFHFDMLKMFIKYFLYNVIYIQ